MICSQSVPVLASLATALVQLRLLSQHLKNLTRSIQLLPLPLVTSQPTHYPKKKRLTIIMIMDTADSVGLTTAIFTKLSWMREAVTFLPTLTNLKDLPTGIAPSNTAHIIQVPATSTVTGIPATAMTSAIGSQSSALRMTATLSAPRARSSETMMSMSSMVMTGKPRLKLSALNSMKTTALPLRPLLIKV